MRTLLALLGLVCGIAQAQISTAPPLINARGTSTPAKCTLGQLFFRTTGVTAGQNIYECTATNVWTQQLGASSIPVGSITGLGTGVATALAVNVGTAGSFVVNGGVLGTPSSGVATNLTGTATGLTAGTATILATTRAIYGNNFDGSAALTQIIASAYGGTGNGFAKFSGPTSSEKTFTLPDASATVLTSNAVVTVAQGGTNAGSASGTALDNITGFASTGFLTRTGSGTYAFQSATNGVTLANLAQSAANTMLGNWSGSTANVAANAMPSCADSGGNHLNYVSGTGITCGTSAGSVTLNNIGTGTTDSTLSTQNSTTGDGPGITITAGDARTGFSNTGGAITINAGGSYLGGTGGGINIKAGPARGSNAPGGAFTLQGGQGGSNTGNGGAITLRGGTSIGSTGGLATVAGGTASAGGTTTNGGGVQITGADSTGTSATGGSINLTGGLSTDAVTGGTLGGTAGRGGATGAGGSIAWTTGAGGTTSGNSGALNLATGVVVSGTIGAINLNPGGVTKLTANSSGVTITQATLLITPTAPTVSSGFGSSPSISANNGTAAFRVNVGTGGSASSGVIGLPTATTGWNCFATDVTTPGTNLTMQSGTSTTSATLTNYAATTGIAAAWAASDILAVSCFAY